MTGARFGDHDGDEFAEMHSVIAALAVYDPNLKANANYCVFCEHEYGTHADDCLHLRAVSLVNRHKTSPGTIGSAGRKL